MHTMVEREKQEQHFTEYIQSDYNNALLLNFTD